MVTTLRDGNTPRQGKPAFEVTTVKRPVLFLPFRGKLLWRRTL